MHINKFILISLVSSAALFSCGPQVKVESQDTNKGTITFFTKDSNLVMQAYPKDNYLFSGWFKKYNDNEYLFETANNPAVVKIDGNTTYQARFEDYSTQTFKYNFDNEKLAYSVYHYYGENVPGNVIIPNTHFGFSVTKIEANTFSGFDLITSVTIPSNIKVIEKNAFKDCTSISKITIDCELTSAYDVFTNWTADQKIELPSKFIITSGDTIKTPWNWQLKENESKEFYTSNDCGSSLVHIVKK